MIDRVTLSRALAAFCLPTNLEYQVVSHWLAILVMHELTPKGP